MGAPLLNWIFRAALAMLALAVLVVVVGLPLPAAARLGLLGIELAAALALASRFLPQFDLLGRIRWRLRRTGSTDRLCALTFDDGPSPGTGKVLDILDAERVPATFFVLGANVRRHPDIVRRAHAAGHALGLHGMTHRKLGGAAAADVERQLDDLLASLDAVGVPPAPLYRTPHGFKSAAVFAVAKRRGLALWAWSRGVWDTAGPSPEVLVRRATRLARPGMVLLLHDGRGEEAQPDLTALHAALPAIIRTLQARGFRFVRLTDNA
jgi:peptidoglycan-N-acetylglucosamine deacetylase